MNPFTTIHRESDPTAQTTVRLCADHLAMARDCQMVDAENVDPALASCPCVSCHFCD